MAKRKIPMMKATVMLAVWMLFLMAAIYHAEAQDARRLPDGTWQMQNYGRNHGVLSGPGIPKCNPHVSDECRRLYPSLMKKVPPPKR
jgi:hypothetical protein